MERMVLLTMIFFASFIIFSCQTAPEGHTAQPESPPAGATVLRADFNDDGVVDRSEFEDAMVARFAELDVNGDGELDQQEFGGKTDDPRRRRLADRQFARQDANADGLVQWEEYRAASVRTFDLLDADGDGILSQEELATAREMAGGALDARERRR